MGLRFDIGVANWIAHVIGGSPTIPSMAEQWMEQEAFNIFRNKLREGFFSSPNREWEFKKLLEHLDSLGQPSIRALEELRGFLGNRPWTALLVPSGYDHKADDFICSKEFLRTLVNIRTEDPGLILQLEEPPKHVFSLTDVFPAFRTALASSTEWPGVLLWTRSGDSVFMPFPSTSRPEMEKAAVWIFSHLATTLGVDLEVILRQYLKEYPQARRPDSKRVTLLHISDIHLGSSEANARIPRVAAAIRHITGELQGSCRIIPVLSGDLMDSPKQAYLDDVRNFLQFLSGLGTHEPVIVLGNHDVRRQGYLKESYGPAIRLPLRTSPVAWYDDLGVGIACFNSVVGGHLARGFIGERQFLDVGSELEAKGKSGDHMVFGVLHHHPTPVELPEWYNQPFYERVLGPTFEATDALEDAASFVGFAEQRGFAAILHGHKHIPRISSTPNRQIPIYGCGSSVGKVSTTDGSTYMSIGLVTIDTVSGQITGRLLAERIPGGGFVEDRRHEMVFRSVVDRHPHIQG